MSASTRFEHTTAPLGRRLHWDSKTPFENGAELLQGSKTIRLSRFGRKGAERRIGQEDKERGREPRRTIHGEAYIRSGIPARQEFPCVRNPEDSHTADLLLERKSTFATTTASPCAGASATRAPALDQIALQPADGHSSLGAP